MSVVRAGFGRNLDFDDIYKHVTMPQEVYLLRNGKISAMASYNRRVFIGKNCLIVEGIAMLPEVQGKGLFREMTCNAQTSETKNKTEIVCLRTQNPRMYRALEKYCRSVYPGQPVKMNNLDDLALAIANMVCSRKLIKEFASYLNCSADENCVVRGYYGGLFYGQEPHHPKIDSLFTELGVNLCKGDGLLVVGAGRHCKSINLGDGIILQDGVYYEQLYGYEGMKPE